MKRIFTRLGMVLILIVASGAVAISLVRRFGAIGDCNTDGDCPPGKVCLTGLDEKYSFARWIRPERRCLISCTTNSDCPPQEECAASAHGFGPGAYCLPRLENR